LDKTPDNLALVMEKVVNTMQVVIRRTSDAMKKEPQSTSPRSKELQLIQSKKDIENPPSTFRVVRVE
jgi:pyridoxine kinase